MKLTTTCATLALTLGLAAASNAAIITGITATSSGSSVQPGDAGTAAANLVDGSGLSGALGSEVHTANLADSWVTTDSSGAGGGADFFGPGGIGATETVQLDFDLGGSFDLTATNTWGYSFFGTTNSATGITVSYSTDGTNFSAAENITLTSAARETNTLNALSATTHVRFQFTDNLGAGNRVGLGEVQFDGVAVAAVPEPSSTALLGLGGLALILRRRK